MSQSIDKLKVALVHDELIRRGGAEILFEELLKMFPQADVYALYSGNDARITVNGITHPIHTSFLQKFPLWWRRHPGRLLPFLPQAAEQFDFSQYDVVISSASGFIKGIITRSGVPHICYLHTPTRYLWSEAHEVARKRGKLLRALQHYLRLADFAAAQRPDVMISNSEYTQARAITYYRRESQVVHPPIDTTFFTPNSQQALSAKPYFLCVGRLTPTKHFEQAIEVCEKLKLPLVVVGAGRERARLEATADRHTTFVGKVSREQLRDLYRGARALIQPGVEDFGMASAEALACGTPVIAYGRGGAAEVITLKKHGLLYEEPQAEYLAEAVRQFLRVEKTFLPEVLQQQAFRFSVSDFRQKMLDVIAKVIEKRNA